MAGKEPASVYRRWMLVVYVVLLHRVLSDEELSSQIFEEIKTIGSLWTELKFSDEPVIQLKKLKKAVQNINDKTGLSVFVEEEGYNTEKFLEDIQTFIFENLKREEPEL